MQYDFETIVDRSSCGAFKWMDMYRQNPKVDKGIVPLSVADMEFVNAPEITEGLKSYLDTHVLGYNGPTDAYYQSVIRWMDRRHGFTVKREWIVTAPGVVPALFKLVEALTEKTDAVLILTPVYHPFRFCVEQQGRHLTESRLVVKNGRYEIDFADVERRLKDPKVKLFLLCSPHNPVGRVWTREELKRLLTLCRENGVFVIADEIHNDLILPGYKHVSCGTFRKELDNIALCTAPSKTFNLAGMKCSNLIIKSASVRKRAEAAGLNGMLNILGYEACRLAYDKAEPWLDALLNVLDGNRAYVESFLKRELPQIHAYPLEGTYLQWLDFRELQLTPKVLSKFLTQKAQLFMDDGFIFGKGGAGFERLNLACPRATLIAAMKRLKTAVDSL